ncbi:MAG: hypothetical protein J6H31_03365 [Butyrivibrio sp.]|nr:hypothetical protein [Butyrivibrio sp.]
MTKIRRTMLIVLGAFLLGISILAGAIVLFGTASEANMDISRSIYEGSHETSSKSEHIRLSQRVTVKTDEGTLPFSGTITKSQDAFYPGTYKIVFSNNAILTDTATIEVKFQVKEGETVYILTGNKDGGYSQYAEVVAKEPGCVEFQTNILQNYTISTTNICGAQEAMASLVGN